MNNEMKNVVLAALGIIGVSALIYGLTHSQEQSTTTKQQKLPMPIPHPGSTAIANLKNTIILRQDISRLLRAHFQSSTITYKESDLCEVLSLAITEAQDSYRPLSRLLNIPAFSEAAFFDKHSLVRDAQAINNSEAIALLEQNDTNRTQRVNKSLRV